MTDLHIACLYVVWIASVEARSVGGHSADQCVWRRRPIKPQHSVATAADDAVQGRGGRCDTAHGACSEGFNAESRQPEHTAGSAHGSSGHAAGSLSLWTSVVISGVLLKMEMGIRKGAWWRAWRYPVYLWSLRWVYAVKKTRRLVYGIYPRMPPNTPLVVM